MSEEERRIQLIKKIEDIRRIKKLPLRKIAELSGLTTRSIYYFMEKPNAARGTTVGNIEKAVKLITEGTVVIC